MKKVTKITLFSLLTLAILVPLVSISHGLAEDRGGEGSSSMQGDHCSEEESHGNWENGAQGATAIESTQAVVNESADNEQEIIQK